MEDKERNSLKVFLRVRPLVGDEVGDEEVPFPTNPTEGDKHSRVTVTLPKHRIGGFSHVFPPEDTNVSVYTQSVSPLVPLVAQGKTAACFCYGHTAAGKTHTILGYGNEKGLFQLAVEQLCRVAAEESPPLLVQLRFAEIYNGKVFDLLNDRSECFVRMSGNEVHIRGATEMNAEGDITIRSLTAVNVRNGEEAAAALAVGIKSRAVGTSSLHDRSSRSHALLEMELVTDEVVKAREAIIVATTNTYRVGKRRDDYKLDQMKNAYQENDQGGWELKPGVTLDQEGMDRLDAEFREAEAAEEVTRAYERSLVQAEGPVGGTLVFVDLAGAEYASEQHQHKGTVAREAKEINRSLLALKECIRAQSRGAKHVPYRNSQLTRLLQRHLEANKSIVAMIANVSPAAKHLTKTVNTMQYAKLVAETTM